jgi:hypothetical protein
VQCQDLPTPEKAVSDTLGRYSRLPGVFRIHRYTYQTLDTACTRLETPSCKHPLPDLIAKHPVPPRDPVHSLKIRMINMGFSSRLVQSPTKQHLFIAVCCTFSLIMVITPYEHALAVYSDQTLAHPHSVR